MPIRQRTSTQKSEENDTPDLILTPKSKKDDDTPDSNGSWEKSFDDELRAEVDAADLKHHRLISTVAPVPTKLDSFLQNYGKFSASTFTADQGLKVLQWSSWAVSYLTKSNSTNKHLSESFRKLYLEMSMTRYALRFYGFFQSLEGYRSGSWAGGDWDNPLIAKVAKYVMTGSMLLYYPLEHVAYAGWQMPKMVKVDANRYSAISCVFWTTYIVGDFWASCLKLAEFKKKLSNLGELLTGKKANDDKKAVEDIMNQQQLLLGKIRHVKLQILRCLLFILPSINWSLPNWATDPLLSELTVNGLMLAESYTSVYQSLRGMLG